MNRFNLIKTNQVIPWIALMCGLQVMILWFNVTLPVIGYWFTYILPFLVLIVFVTTHWKGFFIYSFTSILLVLILIQPFIETTLFYVLPSFFLGIGYGLAIKKQTNFLSLLMLLSMIQFGILYFIQAITFELYQLDMLEVIYSLLNLEHDSTMTLLDPILLYTIALLQILISMFFMLPLLERFQLTWSNATSFLKNELVSFIGLFFITLLSLFFFESFAFIGLGPLLLFTIYSYLYFFVTSSRFWKYFLIFGMVLYPFINAILSSLLEGPYRIFSILFLSIFPIIIVLFNSFTQKRQNALI